MRTTRILRFSDCGVLKDLAEFQTQLFTKKQNDLDTQLWFRGCGSAKEQLRPSCTYPREHAGRKVAGFPPEVERKFLSRFSRYAFQHLGSANGQWETMIIARHYGLPVRILDWTSNPLVAVYFACTTSPATDGALWALQHWGPHDLDLDVISLIRGDDAKTGPFSIYPKRGGGQHAAFKLLPSLLNNPRIIAQLGWFTFHSDPSVAIEDCVGKTFKAEHLDFQRLIKWTIPRAAKPMLIEQLSSVGITTRVLFPDLDGIARGIWESQVLWRAAGELKLR